MLNMNDKGSFSTLQLLRSTYPVGKEGWSALVGVYTYVWDNVRHSWVSKGGSIDWGTILGTLTNQSDLVAYIAAQIAAIDLFKYPIDYIALSQTVTIEQYENYAIYSPLVNDGILINSGSLIIN